MLAPHPHRAEFPHPPGLVYLNHAGVSPLPRRAAAAVRQALALLVEEGAARYPVLDRIQEDCRRVCARLLQGDPERLAFVPNTSEGLSFIGLGLDWAAGDAIVTTDQEFPSNAVIWRDLARRHGLEIITVPSLPDGGVAAERLLAAVTPRTRVLAVSSVQFGSGAVVDLAQLGAGLRGTEVLLVVDAIQGLGALPMAPDRLGIDALCADGHKWLLGPEGLGILYLSPKALERVTPRVLGWHSVANAGDYHTIITDPRPGARRFEAGSPNLLGAAALGASVDLLLAAGPETVRDRVLALTAALADGLRELGCTLHTPLDDQGHPRAGIVVFSHPGMATADLHRALRARGLFHAHRGAGLRYAPHYYQDGTDVERALDFRAVLEGMAVSGGRTS
ncbi:MAG: aminotransferase class V-fold PLP-dependent enzyme [Magnetococcales bacterium]|nr:aminotransferase class V-fold PLP-dependent enzyme [Magnetococcales bacterium]